MIQPALTTTAAFQALKEHHENTKHWHMRDLFAADSDRYTKFSVEVAGLLLDYSKNRIVETTMQLLCELAHECDVTGQRDAMFSGERINRTERRAVLHTALRAPCTQTLTFDGQDIACEIHGVLDSIRIFSERVRSGDWRGYTGKPITDVVNIGIGGSDLGPKMVCAALRSFAHPRLKMYFVANADAHDLDAVLPKLNPETTLFIIASKTFTTQETIMNAQSAREWFLRSAMVTDLTKHFVAVSTNREAVKAFGIDPQNMFPFWDWVGGRYSVWSAIGLSVAVSIGFEHFAEFLSGAHAMDVHFRTAPVAANMPILLALIGLWNRNFVGCTSLAVTPYHQDLSEFTAYIQQLDMESNGKQVTQDGKALGVDSCPIIWGSVGSNGQHAYFQLLHQGTEVIPVDFIAVLQPNHEKKSHHRVLLANCFAQSEALLRGKTEAEARGEIQGEDMSQIQIEELLPHRIFQGNRPSNTLLMDVLTPKSMGALMALYEHKTFVQGVMWNVNSFDQWGVELGKVLAKQIYAELTGDVHPEQHDCSTNALIARAKQGAVEQTEVMRDSLQEACETDVTHLSTKNTKKINMSYLYRQSPAG